MIPILYDSNETEFTSNGLCRLRDCISCRCYEERNGLYEVDFEYPVSGANFDKIQLGRIIGVTHDAAIVPRSVNYRGPITDEENDILTDENGIPLTGPGTREVPDRDVQPFDIVSYSRPINGIVTFHAVHISYRQSKMVSYGSMIYSLNSAFSTLSSVFYPGNSGGNPFTYLTDISSSGYCAAFDGTPRSIRSLLGGTEGSILDTYGGEYEWDKWNVKLHKARGEQKDITIRYGVNMSDFQDETDYSEAFNTCVPYWKDASTGDVVIGGEVLTNHETIGVGNKCVPMDLSDKFEERPIDARVYVMAQDILKNQQPYLPKQTINVDFVRLQDEAGFDKFDTLLQCKLCDSIKVVFPGYDMSAYYKIVKTVWDVLLDRYEEMELGNLSTTLSEALGIDTSGSSSGSTDAMAVVVASGTDGIWNYRKWSDGTSEAWGTASAQLSPYYSGGGFYGYQTGAIAFPADVFSAVPVVNVDGKIGNGFYLGSLIDDISSTQFNAKVMSTDAGPANCIFYIHAIGKWQ